MCCDSSLCVTTLSSLSFFFQCTDYSLPQALTPYHRSVSRHLKPPMQYLSSSHSTHIQVSSASPQCRATSNENIRWSSFLWHSSRTIDELSLQATHALNPNTDAEYNGHDGRWRAEGAENIVLLAR